jgi:DcmR-like sensory protein
VTRKERVIRHGVASEHIVQFFDTTESVADTVSTFLSEGYRRGDHLVVVAKRKHWRAIAPLLKERSGLGATLPTARFTVFEAEAMLASFMRQGLPDSLLFHSTVGDLVRRLTSEHSSVRIYGEMVEVLAAEGNFHAAQRLEELWNELAVRYPFVILCGYSSAHFATSGTREALESLCRTHTHVERKPGDQLAQWLLDGGIPSPYYS